MTRSESPSLPKFAIDDKVKRKGRHFTIAGPVTAIGPEGHFPGVGPARKITWICGTLGEVWDWDFELEAW